MIGVMILGLAVFLALALPVAAVLAAIGVLLAELYSPLPITRAAGELAWTTSTGFLLVSVPLYVMLGQIMLQSGIADRMYTAVAKWLSWLPGGIMHANIGSSALFAATSGSSTATAATIGIVALPQGRKQGYGQRLFLGSLASGGTLGILIPPSITFIIYGALTNTSIPRLYMAGILPGLLLMIAFMAVIVITCLIRPEQDGMRESYSWSERLRALPDLLPPVLIFAVVLGTIYAGIATATESAAFGVLIATGLVFWYRAFSVALVRRVFVGTMETTAMIMLILIAAFFLNWVMNVTGMTRFITEAINAANIGPYHLLFFLVALYLVLGCVMESMSIMVMTLPITVPVVVAAGFDPVWFGVVFVILIECALITPPVGMNLFVIQSLRTEGNVMDVVRGSVPFVAMMLLVLMLLVLVPQIALFLPAAAFG